MYVAGGEPKVQEQRGVAGDSGGVPGGRGRVLAEGHQQPGRGRDQVQRHRQTLVTINFVLRVINRCLKGHIMMDSESEI